MKGRAQTLNETKVCAVHACVCVSRACSLVIPRVCLRHHGVKYCCSVNTHSLPVKSHRSHLIFIALWLSAANAGTCDGAEMSLLGNVQLVFNVFYGTFTVARKKGGGTEQISL